jgi:tetratricopeptide (TPR) repeat protein
MRVVYSLCFALVIQAVAGQTTSPSADIDSLLNAGIAAQKRQDYKTAIDDYRKVLAIQPKMAEARANLGAALSANGQFDAAIEADKLALDVVADKTAVRMNLGLAYYKKGDMANANTEFLAVHAARPSDARTSLLLGYTDIKLNKAADAVALLTPLEPGRESDMDFEYVLGDAMVESGKEEAGLPRLEKAAKATHSPDAWFVAATARMRRSEFREARADTDEALAIAPNFPGLYVLAGQARDGVGDQEGAAQLFETVLRTDPKNPTANLYLGTIRLKMRDLDGARPLLETALQLQPGHPFTRLQIAKLNSMTGKYEEAAATLEDLERNDPAWLDPHVELATIYYKLHRAQDGDREREVVKTLEAKEQKAGPPKPELP